MTSKALMAECVNELAAALDHLRYSNNTAGRLPADLSTLSESQLESADAFTSRFARVVDILCNRVLRGLDLFELNEPGTLLDSALRAEKRGLIPSADWMREMKDVRNRIAHDYAGHKTAAILAFCRERTPELLAACEKTLTYARSRLNGN